MSDMITDPKPPQSPQLFDDATVAEFNTAQLDTVQSDTAQLNSCLLYTSPSPRD